MKIMERKAATFHGECKAVAKERSALETARDARIGNLDDEALWQAFYHAYQVFAQARDAHIGWTGCQGMH